MASTTTTRTIQYLEGSRFVDKVVDSTTVGQLRCELEIPSNAAVSVNRADVNDSFGLSDGDQVAAVVSNKTGGQ